MKVEKLTKLYKNNRGIKDISFEIGEGEILAVLGVNGSGKSTLFKTITGLIRQDSGEIFATEIGYIPENRSLYKDITVKEHLELYARLHGMEFGDIELNIEYWMNYLEIGMYLNSKIMTLSKGNQQKVQILCGLIHDPQTIIMDEPLSGLDIHNMRLIKGLLRKLSKSGKSILISSHQYEEVEEVSDYILILKDGVMKKYGSLNDLKIQAGITYFIVEKEQYYDIKHLGLDYKFVEDKVYVIIHDKNTLIKVLPPLIEKRFVEKIVIDSVSLKEMVEMTYEDAY
ncbi:ATP-binding cassette domain-containing protein [Erysipelothrix amsterdamensis]|uniref:ATP-binding cassette domain-containing protein n=1 Tax=Erysipelothrix amsterdamensis TaxID=2929157 RepID=A0AAU9VHH9_9FIRM|nr:ATP-binding cassette domain-containing protein [Erysipelothrix sp. A18Y020d]CAH2760709.1 ATP-binding cassette domain-containing protein [Erysipelothrix sp. A18Y020d]